jgi:group I intron endonuclease
MKRYGVIYKITNNINNKIYIGQTIHTFDKRYWNNLYKYTHNIYLKRAIKKYGIENFHIDKEVYIAYSKEELDKKEKELIKLYKCNNKKYGYNYLSGGHNGTHNAESRKKISEAQKGQLNHMYGKYGKENPKYSRVPMNCSYCGKEIEVLKSNIKRSKHHYCSIECKKKDHKNIIPKKQSAKIEVKCSNCDKTFMKYPSQIKGKKYIYCSRECQAEHYKILNKGDNNPNSGNGEKIKGGKNGRAKKVLCITTGEIFESARDAEIKYSISRGLVQACCRKEQKTSKGMEWEYINN